MITTIFIIPVCFILFFNLKNVFLKKNKKEKFDINDLISTRETFMSDETKLNLLEKCVNEVMWKNQLEIDLQHSAKASAEGALIHNLVNSMMLIAYPSD